MKKQTKQAKRKSTIAWVMTIVVTVVAILSAVIGVFGLIQGYNMQMDRVYWFSITSIVLGTVVAILSGWTFGHKIESKGLWWLIQIFWILCSIGLIVIGVLGSIYMHYKGGEYWLPICVTINGGILLGDKIQYFIGHFDRLAKQAKKS